MATKRILHGDLFEPKITANIIKEMDALIKKSNETEKELKEILAVLKEIKSVKSAKGLKAFTDQTEKLSIAQKELAKTDKAKIKIATDAANSIKKQQQARLADIKTQKDRERAFDKFEKQQQKNIKTAQKARKQTIDSANAFKTLSKQTNTAQARFKRLAAQYGITSKAAINAGKTFKKLDDRLRKINNSARDGRRDVGRYGLALQKVRGALSTGLGALGITAGIAGLGRVIGNVIGVFSGFQKSNSQLQAVLGESGTKGNMDLLKQSAKELGATTAFTAAEVTGLQIEFAKLGFDPKAIDNATEATLALAAAAGVDLAEAASVAGATLGGFGLGAEETARVTDVMAKSFSTSALDMEKFKESMKSAAPAASAVGVSVEKTTALLGTLANAGISGSKAGNNLKTTFINLNASGLTLEEGLEKVAKSQDKLGTAAKLVGKNAAASFLVLAEGVDTTKKLEEGLNDAAGAAQAMADIQLDNLAGSITILGSAWEGFILSLEDGEGTFSNLLRTIVDVATELLSMATGTAKAADELDEAGLRVRNIANTIKVLAKVVGTLLVSFIAYRATLKAINLATKLYTLTTKALRIAQIALKGGLKGATKAMKGFNTASKANIIGALVALLALAVTAYYAFRDAAKEAADAERDRQLAVAEGEALQKSIEDRIKILTQLNKVQLVTLLRDIEAGKEKLKIDEKITENLLRQAELKKILEEGTAGTTPDPLTGQEIDLTPFLEEELRLNIENTDALNNKLDVLENERILVQARLDFLNKQVALSKKAAAGIDKEEQATRDLIKRRKAQLKIAKDLEATDENEIIIRKRKIEIIQAEIDRLEALGDEKKKQETDKSAIESELKASDELFNEIQKTRREGIIAATEEAEKNRQLRETDLRLQAKFETDLAEENSDDRILIAEKLKNDLAAIERERVADVEAANKKIAEDDERLKQERIDNAVEFGNKVFDALRNELDRRNDAVNEAFDDEISSLQESIDRQIESGKAGGEEKLANDQALLAKTKLERQRELEAQAKQDRLIALSQQFVNSAAAHAKDNPEGAIALALAETFAAQGIAQLIAGFEKGGLVEGGEQIIRINEKGQEFVMDAKTTKAFGLDKKGSTMADFHKKFNHNINIPEHLFKNLDAGGLAISAADYSDIINSQKETANMLASTIKKSSGKSEILLDGLGRVVTKLKKNGLTNKIVYESDADLL